MEADPAPPAATAGRPSLYTVELGEEIAERMVNGESLTAICRDEAMPHRGTVFRWLMKHPEFAALYREARMIAAELMADELLEIADDASQDWTVGERGGLVPDHELVNRSRLRVDTRKWVLSKVLPHRWGDRLGEHPPPPAPGATPEAPLHVAAVPVSPEQREAALRAIGAREIARREREASALAGSKPAGNA